MSSLGSCLLLLADANGNAMMGQLMGYAPFVLIFILFFVMILRPAQQDAKRRASQLAALKKNDRVYTSSGIIGTIANFSADGKEVTLKVDDNVKIRIFRRAIEGLYSDSTPSDSGSST